MGEDAAGYPDCLESLSLGHSAAEFDTKLAHPQAFANEVGAGLGEYLTRVLSQTHWYWFACTPFRLGLAWNE